MLFSLSYPDILLHIDRIPLFFLGAVMKTTIKASHPMLDIISVIDDSLIWLAGHSNQAHL